jgi:hypothetical protein
MASPAGNNGTPNTAPGLSGDPFKGSKGVGGPADDVDTYTAGDDINYLDRAGTFEVSANMTLKVQTVQGTVFTWAFVAGRRYDIRINRIFNTGSTFGGGTVLVYTSAVR